MNIPPLLRRNRTSIIALSLNFICVLSLSASLTVTTSNQQGSLPFTPGWSPASDSLIADMSPTTASGNFSLDVAGRVVESLTSGGSLTITELPGNNTSTNYLSCGNGAGAGSLLIYTLPASVNGYDLTHITVHGGWKDSGRDQQAYTLSYATVANPSSFTPLTMVNYNPSVPPGTASATRVTIADSAGAVLVSSVVALKFDFTNPASENGYCGYAAIIVQGTAASPPSGPPAVSTPSVNPPGAAMGATSGPVVTLSASAVGSIPMSYQWRTDGGSGGAMSNISGAISTNLEVNTTGYDLATYRYDFIVTNSLGTNISPAALISIIGLSDIGTGAPLPGATDISQLFNASQNDDGFNYYTDNGANYGKWCGQTFTTGPDQDGYMLKSFAWKSAGNGSRFNNSQPYNLYFYSFSEGGSQATVIASYTASSAGTENHWLQWQGLNVPLAPNQTYAYAFGRDGSGSGWEHIGNQGGDPYTQGQLMTASHTTGLGPITYGLTGNSDATFNLGLTTYQMSAPRALPPTYTADSWPIYAGTPGIITLHETALGSAPFTYQWLSDEGEGGAMASVSGGTDSNMTVNIGSLSMGTYKYAVIVSNAFGSSLSDPFTLIVLGPTAPSVVMNVTPAPVNVANVGQSTSFSATFFGTPPITHQWLFNNGFGPTPISIVGNPSAGSSTLILSNLQLTNDGVYSVVAHNHAGSATSSASTLVVNPPVNTPPPPVTVPPITLQVSNSPGLMHLQWAQGTLQQATNLVGSWTPLATNLEAASLSVPMTNTEAFFRSKTAPQPRIVSLYCFCRDQDYRIANSQQVLFNATTQQVQLFKQANLPATFALQHDALVDTNYEHYFKTHLDSNDEIGAWWEITQTLAESAGLTWRGNHEWVSTANIAFSPGYTPVERIQLVDAYMLDFKAIYGYYPKTVGSWYIDEVTLEYMRQQYGVIASANCKDQLGTDSYTLWGSYWNQAYYPSILNSYMPAQTQSGQIDMPVFRLLGSDPIYQYGNFTPGIYTLEPVYFYSGGSPTWTASYVNSLIKQPSLAFGFTQAGQENSFGWSSMAAGLTSQVALIAAEAQAGNIQVMTLAQAGEWFRNNYSVTPPTSVVTLDDFKQQGRKSVWYNSRFFRCNVLWDQGTFYIRDIHCFDEGVMSYTHSTALATDYFVYETLPVMDGGLWSGNGDYPVGMWPVMLPGGNFMTPQGLPIVHGLNPTDLGIVQPLSGGGAFSIACTESNITCIATNGLGAPLSWAWDLAGGSQQSSVVQNVSTNSVSYNYNGENYQIKLDAGSCQQLENGNIRLTPDVGGRIILNLDVTD